MTKKFQNLQQKKWYVNDSESKGNYSYENRMKFLASSFESNLCDYSDAYILVTGILLLQELLLLLQLIILKETTT